MPGFDEVFAPLPADQVLEDAVMDKGYDRNHLRAKFQGHAMHPVMPPKSNRKEAIAYDKDTDRLREQVERFLNRLKQFRRIATRYDKLGYVFLAFMHMGAACLIVK
jgi:putative transposase